MTMAPEEFWFKFSAINSESLFAYGTPEQASTFADKLNEKLAAAMYSEHRMSDVEIADRPHLEDEGFSLADELVDFD